MERDEFVAAYMSRSGINDYHVDGDRVYWGGDHTCALPCECGEADCDGWAMVPPNGRWWHLFNSGPDEGRPTYKEAIAQDMAYMEAKDRRRSS